MSSELNTVNARWGCRNTPLPYHFHGKLGFSLGCVSLLFLDVEGWGWVLLSEPRCSAPARREVQWCVLGGLKDCIPVFIWS